MRTRPAFGRRLRRQRPRVGGRRRVHLRSVSREGEPNPGRELLLGGVAQLCHSLFHCSPTPELASHPTSCACASRRSRRGESARPTAQRGGRRASGSSRGPCSAPGIQRARSSHAEEYVLRDEVAASERSSGTPRTTRAIVQNPGLGGHAHAVPAPQPCHGSSDNRGPLCCSTRSSTASTASCSGPGGCRCAWR